MSITRRAVLTGLIAAPAIVSATNIMPVKALSQLRGLDRYLQWFEVIDKYSGLIVKKSKVDILADNEGRYLVHMQFAPDKEWKPSAEWGITDPIVQGKPLDFTKGNNSKYTIKDNGLWVPNK